MAMSWVFMDTDFFSPKSSNAKYSMLGTSEANFGGKKNRYNTQGSTVHKIARIAVCFSG